MSQTTKIGARMSELSDDLKEYIDQRDTAVEQRIKLWIFGSILTQVLALLPVIFFLGGIYADGRTAVKLLNQQQVKLAQQSEWQKERERWEVAMEMWARRQGYEPPIFTAASRRSSN